MLSRFAITTYKKIDLTSTIIFGLLFPSIKLMKSSVLFLYQTPVHTIAANAGVEGAVVVGKLLEQDNPDLGYDAAKGLLLTYHVSFSSSLCIPILEVFSDCFSFKILMYAYFCSFLFIQVNMWTWSRQVSLIH